MDMNNLLVKSQIRQMNQRSHCENVRINNVIVRQKSYRTYLKFQFHINIMILLNV